MQIMMVTGWEFQPRLLYSQPQIQASPQIFPSKMWKRISSADPGSVPGFYLIRMCSFEVPKSPQLASLISEVQQVRGFPGLTSTIWPPVSLPQTGTLTVRLLLLKCLFANTYSKAFFSPFFCIKSNRII